MPCISHSCCGPRSGPSGGPGRVSGGCGACAVGVRRFEPPDMAGAGCRTSVGLALAAMPERSGVHAQKASRGEESSGGTARTASHLARSWSPRRISTSTGGRADSYKYSSMEPVPRGVRHKEYADNALRVYGGGSRHFVHGWMRCPVHWPPRPGRDSRISPGCHRHALACGRPCSWDAGAIGWAGSSPGRGRRAVHRRNHQQRSIPAVAATGNLSVDWYQPAGVVGQGRGQAVRPCRRCSARNQQANT